MISLDNFPGSATKAPYGAFLLYEIHCVRFILLHIWQALHRLYVRFTQSPVIAQFSWKRLDSQMPSLDVNLQQGIYHSTRSDDLWEMVENRSRQGFCKKDCTLMHGFISAAADWGSTPHPATKAPYGAFLLYEIHCLRFIFIQIR